MDREETEQKAKEVRERINTQRVLKITKGLRNNDLFPPKKVDVLEDEMLGWDNDQLESMERFIDMAVKHAEMKVALHKTKLELQSQATGSYEGTKIKDKLNETSPEEMEAAAEVVATVANNIQKSAGEKMHEASKKDLERMHERHGKVQKKAEEAKKADAEVLNNTVDEFITTSADEATKLTFAMSKAGLIDDSSFEEQVEEIKKWPTGVLSSMWAMVDKAARPLHSAQPQVEARKWGPGSEIAKEHRNKHQLAFARVPPPVWPPEKAVQGLLDKFQNADVEKEIVVDEPNPRKSIKDAFQEAGRIEQSRPINLTSYHKRGSLKDRKEEADRKTTKEPVFIAELRQARELLEKFDESFANARVGALKAKEVMLHEERKYNGTKLHEDTSELHSLTKAHMKSQRDFAIIDKVYKQAFKAFELTDVEQASVEELNKALENFHTADTITNELDMVWGGKYSTGDEPYYKWVNRKRYSSEVDKVMDTFKEVVGQLPSEVAGEHKRSADAVSPFHRNE